MPTIFRGAGRFRIGTPWWARLALSLALLLPAAARRFGPFRAFAPGWARLALAFALALPAVAGAQALSRAEKLEGKLRVAMLKANRDIQGPWIKAAELKAILADTNLILVDVRQIAEQQVSMLPHALTTARFAEAYRHGIPPGKRLVLYCTIGYRSGKYGEQLAAMGIKSEVLEGGILMWSFAGGPLAAPDGKGGWEPTNRIHVYDAEWNIVHPDYVAVLP